MDESLVEDHRTEFKQCSKGRIPKSLAETIVAFANSEGGRILCGVNDLGQPINLTNRQLDKLQTTIASQCKNIFNIIITPEIYKINRHLTVLIQPASAYQRPVYIKKQGLKRGSYIRVGASNQLASDQILQSLMVAAQGGAERQFFPGHYYQDSFDLPLIGHYIEILAKTPNSIWHNFTKDEILLKLRAVNSKSEVSLFGLLAFAKDDKAQELISPSIKVEVTSYGGFDKINPDNVYEAYTDNRSFRGNVKNQFEQALAYILHLMPRRGVIDHQTGFRQDIARMPEIAIREALVNSLVHRDYAVFGGKIAVDIYTDRIEIINPGISLVPISQLDVAGSLTRNPYLMSFLRDIGLVEEKARGIRTIKIALEQANLKQPQFENIAGQFFKVTMYNSLLVSSQDMIWLKQLAHLKLKQNQINALVVLNSQPQFTLTNKSYRGINNLTQTGDDLKARKELGQLVDFKLLKPVGQNKARQYILTTSLRSLIGNHQ